MDYSYIKQLLDRYWNGTTTLEEERILRAFFSQKDLPQEFAMYRDIFAYEAQKPTLGSDFDERMMAMIEEEKPVKLPLSSPWSSRWATPCRCPSSSKLQATSSKVRAPALPLPTRTR